MRIDFFNIDAIAARRLLIEQPWPPVTVGAPHLLIAGINGFARAVIVEAARVWRLQDPDGDRPITITVIGDGAAAATETLARRYAFLDQTTRLQAVDSDLITMLENGRLGQAPDWAVMCHANENHALKAGVTAERLWRRGPHTVIVRMDGAAALLAERDRTGQHQLFVGYTGSVRVFGAVHAACHAAFIADDLVEQLARVIHDRYLLSRRRHGETASTDQSMLPWEQLSPRLRQTNRSQAEDIGRKLSLVGRSVAPRLGPDDDLLASEIEVMAEAEHQRWREELTRAGWIYGTAKSITRKTHPGLRPWATLEEDLRRRTVDAVRELPIILADAGFRIVRS